MKTSVLARSAAVASESTSGADQSRQAARVMALAAGALLAFASNSLLCRVALRSGSIDPALFTGVRLASGAALLLLVWGGARPSQRINLAGSWWSAFALFSYAATFSFAYLRLSAGTGALILFPSVQATMMLVGLSSGERPGTLQWVGFAVAVAGLVYMVLPGLSAPPLASALLMAVAGMSWGIYTLRGKRAGADPVGATAGNFARALPFAILAIALYWTRRSATWSGVGWAVLSGAITSGLGYVAWYAAVRHLTTTRAAVLQLAVPALAAGGGVVLLDEVLTLRLVISGSAILGGVAVAIAARQKVWRKAP